MGKRKLKQLSIKELMKKLKKAIEYFEKNEKKRKIR
jgi:hypothetical protein